MALFDKLRTALDRIVNKSQNMNRNKGTTETNALARKDKAHPLADETLEKYFEIICGMKYSMPRFYDAAVEKEKAKKYIEYFLKCVCDEEKLENALALYHASKINYPSNARERELWRSRLRFEEKNDYCLEIREARKLFWQEEIAAATEEYNKILEVIKDNINYIHFSQGLRKLDCDYTIQIIVISESFCSGNSITQELIKQYLLDNYTTRINDESYKENHYVGDDIALLIVKALHFEKYGHDRENYKTASYEEYLDYVVNVDGYKKAIDNHPFEKEYYAEKFAKRIMKNRVFGSPYSSFGKEGFYISDVEDYFCDAACHFLWTEIVRKGAWVDKNGKEINETRDYNELTNILATYFIQ